MTNQIIHAAAEINYKIANSFSETNIINDEDNITDDTDLFHCIQKQIIYLLEIPIMPC